MFTEKKKFKNLTPETQSYTFSGQTSVTDTESHSRTNGFEIEVGATFSFKVSEILISEEGSVNFGIKTSHSWTVGKEESKTKTFTFE